MKEVKNHKELVKVVKAMSKDNVVYNVSIKGTTITIKEKSMAKKLTVNDAMVAIAALTTTVNGLVTTVNNLSTTVTQGFKAVQSDIARLDNKIDDVETRLNNKIDDVETRLNNKIDNIVLLNNLKT